MKNSQENLPLPTFNVTLVTPNDENPIITPLSQHLQNQGLILYFYPKDNTAGCTTQAKEFSERLDEFTKLGFVVIGVSRDSVKSHQNFMLKQDLNLALISDTDETLCGYFDVIKPKQLYGKTYLGVVRSTFVFDKTGKMTASFRNVKAKGHVAALLDLLKDG